MWHLAYNWLDDTIMRFDHPCVNNLRLRRTAVALAAVLALLAMPSRAQDAGAQAVPPTGSAPVAKAPSAIDKRLRLEKNVDNNPFGLVPHKPNYILPITYNDSPNQEPFADEEHDLDEEEMKFQLSLKVLMIKQVFDDYSQLSFGYTNQSYFQIYNRELSAPFRETNHEPALAISTSR
jgi:outer membrane phospholipase A